MIGLTRMADADTRAEYRARFHAERVRFWDQRAAAFRAQPPAPGPITDQYAALLAQPRPEGREEMIAQTQRLEVLYSILLSLASDPAARPAIFRERVTGASAAAGRDPPPTQQFRSFASAPTAAARPPTPGPGSAPAATTAAPAASLRPAVLPPVASTPAPAASLRPSVPAREPTPGSALSDWTPSEVPTSEISPDSLAARNAAGGLYSGGTSASSVPTSELFARQDRRTLGLDYGRMPANLRGPPSIASTPLSSGTSYNDDDRYDDSPEVGVRPLSWEASEDGGATTDSAAASSVPSLFDDIGASAGYLSNRYRQLPPRPPHFPSGRAPATATSFARAPAPVGSAAAAGPAPRAPTASARVSTKPPAPSTTAAAAAAAAALRPRTTTSGSVTPTVASSNAERVDTEDLRRFLNRGELASLSGDGSDVSSVETLYAEWRSRYRRIVTTMESSHH